MTLPFIKLFQQKKKIYNFLVIHHIPPPFPLEAFLVTYRSRIPWKESYNKPRQSIEKQRYYFANKGPYSQSYGFSSSQVQMWELDHKEGFAQKIWCFQFVVLEKISESPLEGKEIKSVNPKQKQL